MMYASQPQRKQVEVHKHIQAKQASKIEVEKQLRSTTDLDSYIILISKQRSPVPTNERQTCIGIHRKSSTRSINAVTELTRLHTTKKNDQVPSSVTNLYLVTFQNSIM